MLFKSEAQRRKFAQLLVEGKISDETYDEWNRSTRNRALPERARKKRTAQRPPSGRRKKSTSAAARKK